MEIEIDYFSITGKYHSTDTLCIPSTMHNSEIPDYARERIHKTPNRILYAVSTTPNGNPFLVLPSPLK